MLCSGIQEVVQWMDSDDKYPVWAPLSFASLGLGIHSLRSAPKVIVKNLFSKVSIANKRTKLAYVRQLAADFGKSKLARIRTPD
jgi:hypothetical protein